MKYENANNILPPELIRQVQKYAAGKLLYIPQKEEQAVWGSLSGAREKLRKRNQRIYNEYKSGKGVGELSEEYFLSIDSIRKIVYGADKYRIPFFPTMQNAMQYNQAGLAEEWLRTYYVKTYGETSYPEEWICDGLINIPLRLIDNEGDSVLQQAEKLPLLIRFQMGRFYYLGSREHLETLRRQHITAYPAFIFVTDKEEYAFYETNYGRHFHRIQFSVDMKAEESTDNKQVLFDSIDKVHTTPMGIDRIKRNLELCNDIDVVLWCREKIMHKGAIIKKQGKNWYIRSEGCIITVNASSYTIITAHKEK